MFINKPKPTVSNRLGTALLTVSLGLGATSCSRSPEEQAQAQKIYEQFATEPFKTAVVDYQTAHDSYLGMIATVSGQKAEAIVQLEKGSDEGFKNIMPALAAIQDRSIKEVEKDFDNSPGGGWAAGSYRKGLLHAAREFTGLPADTVETRYKEADNYMGYADWSAQLAAGQMISGVNGSVLTTAFEKIGSLSGPISSQQTPLYLAIGTAFGHKHGKTVDDVIGYYNFFAQHIGTGNSTAFMAMAAAASPNAFAPEQMLGNYELAKQHLGTSSSTTLSRIAIAAELQDSDSPVILFMIYHSDG